MRVRALIVGSVLGASILAPASPARADTAQVISAAATFIAPVAVMEPGDTLVLNNQDVIPHNLASTIPGQFQSATIGMGQTAVVEGAESLGPGQYRFVCTLHPWMVGVLAVQTDVDQPILPPTDGGTPALPSSPYTISGAVPTPSSVAAHGRFLYVTSYVQGAVYRLRISDLEFIENGTLVADGFTNPLGVQYHAPTNTLFVADSHASDEPGRTTDGRVWAVKGGKKQVVIDGLPNGRHNTNGMAIHGDRLYIANGNSTDDGLAGGEPEVPPYSGSLLSVPLTARGLTPDDATVEATGMRNVYDVAFRPGTSEAWVTTNGPDALEPFGEDLLHKVDVTGDAADFGFPGCVYRAGPGGPTDPEAGDNPVIDGPCGAHTPPEVTLGLHVSADGLAFGPANSPWDGDIFIAEFGNFFGAPAGRKIVRVPIDANGVASAPQDVFVGAGPLDVTFAYNHLIIADFAASQIILLTKENAAAAESVL